MFIILLLNNIDNKRADEYKDCINLALEITERDKEFRRICQVLYR